MKKPCPIAIKHSFFFKKVLSKKLFLHNCSCRTNCSTGATFYAKFRINNIDITFADSFYRAFTYTRTTGQTFICNFICHFRHLLLKLLVKYSTPLKKLLQMDKLFKSYFYFYPLFFVPIFLICAYDDLSLTSLI